MKLEYTNKNLDPNKDKNLNEEPLTPEERSFALEIVKEIGPHVEAWQKKTHPSIKEKETIQSELYTLLLDYQNLAYAQGSFSEESKKQLKKDMSEIFKSKMKKRRNKRGRKKK
jgi:hypothetical protein